MTAVSFIAAVLLYCSPAYLYALNLALLKLPQPRVRLYVYGVEVVR